MSQLMVVPSIFLSDLSSHVQYSESIPTTDLFQLDFFTDRNGDVI
jgi:hypothetical protein